MRNAQPAPRSRPGSPPPVSSPHITAIGGTVALAVGESIEVRHSSLTGAHTLPHPDDLRALGYEHFGVDPRYNDILMYRRVR